MPEIVSLLEELDEVDPQACYVVIDVFRFSTTAAVLLNNGIASLKPFHEVNEALRWKRDSKRLLVGERSGEIIDGFDYNNSPTTLLREGLPTSQIGILTTNGTRALDRVKDAEAVYLGSTVNARAVADVLPEDKDIILLAVGTEGAESPEDVVGAELIKRYYEDDPPVSTRRERMKKRMRESPYADHLRDLGFELDVEYACLFNLLDVVPVMENGVIKGK